MSVEIDMTFEEFKKEFKEMLYSILESSDSKEEIENNMKKINFEWEYEQAIKDKEIGRSPNLKAYISSAVYCMYMNYPDIE